MAQSVTTLWEQHKGDDCLIVGGGRSVCDVNFDKFQGALKIGINFNVTPIDFDYMVYMDDDVRLWYDIYEHREKVIAFKNNAGISTDFTYTKHDIEILSHTGSLALQIAYKMGFDNIYLAGYDYYVNEHRHYYSDSGCNVDEVKAAKYHYYKYTIMGGEKKEEREKKQYEASIVNPSGAIRDFDSLNYKNVYNLNPKSNLKKYRFVQKPT
jgi:hypothetical protein